MRSLPRAWVKLPEGSALQRPVDGWLGCRALGWAWNPVSSLLFLLLVPGLSRGPGRSLTLAFAHVYASGGSGISRGRSDAPSRVSAAPLAPCMADWGLSPPLHLQAFPSGSFLDVACPSGHNAAPSARAHGPSQRGVCHGSSVCMSSRALWVLSQTPCSEAWMLRCLSYCAFLGWCRRIWVFRRRS